MKTKLKCLSLDYVLTGLRTFKNRLKHTQLNVSEKEKIPCFLYLIHIYLNRALKQISQLKLNLEARFKLVVKGMGDLRSFVTRDYPKYLSYVDDLKFPVKKWSDSRARDMSELLNRLIGKIILNICKNICTQKNVPNHYDKFFHFRLKR